MKDVRIEKWLWAARLRIVALVAVVLATVGSTAYGGTSGISGRLAFSAMATAPTPDRVQLFVAHLGTGPIRRLPRTDGARSPSWSPSGKQIVYGSGEPWQLWKIDASGHHRRRLTSGRLNSGAPDWSRSGRIVFVSWESGDYLETDLYSIKSNGSDLRQLTDVAGQDIDPAWSPDGTQIAFSSDRDQTAELSWHLYVMNADGSGVRRLTPTADASEYAPAWSPDGTRIAFWRRVWGGTDSVVVASNDGSNERTLAKNGLLPTWSPDGKHIAYVRPTNNLAMGEVWVMRNDGTDRHRLVKGAFEDPQELDWTRSG